MFIGAIIVLMSLAWIRPGSRPFAVVLTVQACGTWLLQSHGLWGWMPWLDAAVFYALLACWGLCGSGKRGPLVVGISGLTLVVHAAYYWPQPSGAYYGNEYLGAMQALYLIALAILALGDFDARSFVGNVRKGLRSLFGDSAGSVLARQASMAKQGEKVA